MEPMIFVYGSGQHDHNEQMEPDLLLLDSELFALLTHFFNNISSWEVHFGLVVTVIFYLYQSAPFMTCYFVNVPWKA